MTARFFVVTIELRCPICGAARFVKTFADVAERFEASLASGRAVVACAADGAHLEVRARTRSQSPDGRS